VTTRVQSATFDCKDPLRQARFWALALAYTIDDHEEDPTEVGISDPSGDGVMLYFNAVPEPKIVKNRMHLDIEPDTSLEAEVDRLVEAGARVVATRQDPEGHLDPYRWTVLQDPEGNEFCVVKSLDRDAG
jgi:hypothetical protein